MSGPWRAALRLAGREVRRARWRSALVVAMVGVPVLLIVAFTVLLQTVGEAQSEPVVLLRQLGAADAQIVSAGREPVAQDALGRTAPLADAPATPGAGEPWTVRELAEAAGGRVLPVLAGGTLIRTDAGALSARVRELDLRDPLTTGLATLTEGRAPRTPDEVAVSRAVADRGFGVGAVVRLVDGGERTVVGLVRNPAALRESEVVGLPGSVLTAGAEPTYLVDTAGTPVSWQRVRELNALGLVVNSRAVLENPPPDDQLPSEVRPATSTSGIAQMLAVLIMGSVVLEVALLAGPAFAVSARRQRRQLALVAATGGTPADVRRMVLAQGLVLGVGAAVTGAALGIVAVAAALPLLDQLVGFELGGPRVDPVRVVLVVGVGAAAALAAAFFPAVRASREDTVAGLAGRRGEVHFQRRRPIAGLLVGAVGLAAAAFGMRASSGGEMPVVLGTFALVVGAILVMPAVLGVVGRLGGRLPLSLRLAARDVARHRGRTASAVSAIMGAVIGVTALAIGTASDFAQNDRDYVPREAMGSLAIDFDSGVHAPSRSMVTDRDAETLAAQVEGLLPGRTAQVLYAGGGKVSDGEYQNVDLHTPGCAESDDNPCVWSWSLPDLSAYGLPMLVGDADTVGTVLGRPLTASQRAVLDDGGVLVPSASAMDAAGVAHVTAGTYERSLEVDLPAAVLPELMVPEGANVRLVAGLAGTRATAERLGLTVAAHRIWVAPGGPDVPGISEEREAGIDELVRGFVPVSRVYVERGFTDSYLPLWLILGGLGGLIVLAGTLTATALAMDDARPDLATLAAIGASPRIRRRQAMAQAALTGLLGALLGVAVGAVPGLAITWPLTEPSTGGHIVDIPWSLLGTVVLLVPLVAIAGAGLLTRSHLPMVRRLP